MDYNTLMVEIGKLIVGIFLGTIFTTWYKDFKRKKDDRKWMFIRLLDSKSYVKIPQSRISDLNMLPVLFRGKKKVLEKYNSYYKELCLPADQLDYVNQQALYLDLLREMGNVVGYKHLDNNVLNSRYIPNAAMDEHEYQAQFRANILPYLKSGHQLHDLLIDFYKNPPPATQHQL
jgi:hypothetical protein